MKRLSGEQLHRLVRLARQRGLRKALQRRRAESRRRLGKLLYERTPRAPREAPAIHIKSPEHLSLRPEDYHGTMDFLLRLRKAALDEGRRVILDLRACNFLSPEIAPLLAAEFQRIRYFRGSAAIGGASPQAAGPRQLLHRMGFFELLGLRDPVQEDDDSAPYVTIRSGTSLDGQVTKDIADDFAEALVLSDEQREFVQKALNEALENISEHAYFDKTKITYPAELGRWWVCSISAKEPRSAFLLACDLGMTIPATVPETARRHGAANLAALAKFLDGSTATREERLLAAAFEDTVTRRPDGKGGRGLGKMAQLAQEFEGGRLTVWSGSAAAVLSSSAAKVTTHSLPMRFHGTYIVWNLTQAPES